MSKQRFPNAIDCEMSEWMIAAARTDLWYSITDARAGRLFAAKVKARRAINELREAVRFATRYSIALRL